MTYKGLLVFVCVKRDVCRGRSGLNQIILESILHVVGQDQYVEGVLQCVIGVDPVFVRADWD